MKTKKKILTVLAIVGCAILLVAGSIAGTVAYLTATDSVTNTFTVGNVSITLDESDASAADPATAPRVKANTYHLVPNGTYDKDPTIHLAAKSDACYLFVKVVNNIQGAEKSGATSVANQMAANNWVALAGEENVYVYTVSGSSVVATSDSVQDFVVFEHITIDAEIENTALAAYQNKTIEVTAYAVQAAGFASAADAWDATFGA